MSTPTDTHASAAPSAAPGPPAARRRRRPGGEWLLFAALLVAVMAPVSGLWDVIEGRRWFENSAVTVAGMLAAGTIVRVLGRSYALVLTASAAGLAVMLTLQFLPSTAVLGVLPTAETLRRALAFYPQAQEAILSQSQPVLAEDPIVFFTALAAGLTGLMAQIVVLGLRAPALAAIPLSVFLITSSVVKTDGAGLLHVGLTAAGFLLVLAASRIAFRSTAPAAAVRTGVARQGAAIAAGALALMLLVPLAVPGFTQGLMPQGQRLYLFGKPSGVNPVLNLGVNLRDRLGLTTVTYYTDSPDPLYLRTAVISDLTADRWEPTDVTVPRDTSTGVLAPTERERLAGLLPDAATKRLVHTRVVTGNYQSPWLPMPRDATSVSGLAETWGYYGGTQTMFSDEKAASMDLDYTVTSQVPVIDAAALEASSRALANGLGAINLPSAYTDLPSQLPAIIEDTARKITRAAGATTAYEEAVALQEELRSPDYSYSEQTPLQQGYDGNGIGVVEAFLQKKSGYCTHFSSAMALMARSLGIPSRIVVGYAPGRTNGATALGTDGKQWSGYELSARSAHAWPELFF
ncbi:transglutaminaseTgpA domain-containing protein, partial [Arthrobacter sp.]|uniref:transglutaminase family protein n=1 Tax=Arthrobacter sp. TaxID=1667 RepID=UPI003A8F04B1